MYYKVLIFVITLMDTNDVIIKSILSVKNYYTHIIIHSLSLSDP